MSISVNKVCSGHAKRVAAAGMAVFLATSITGSHLSAEEQELVAPFDLTTQAEWKDQRAINASCPEPPLPIVDLTGPEQSVEPETKTIVYRYQRNLNKISDSYVVSGAVKPLLANCVVTWLYLWARHGAMLGEANAEGVHVRGAGLAPPAMAFLKVHGDPHLDSHELDTVATWLHDWARAVQEDYSTNLEAASRQNHHLYWATWSVVIAAVATGDRGLFDWSLDRARFGLAQIDVDGMLPLAMERKERALEFHLWSVAPLVMIAETAAANGIDLYSENDGALHRVVARSISALEDPASFGSEIGFEQTIGHPLESDMLAWIVVYAKRHPDRLDPRWFNLASGSTHRLFGGDIRLLYIDLVRN